MEDLIRFVTHLGDVDMKLAMMIIEGKHCSRLSFDTNGIMRWFQYDAEDCNVSHNSHNDVEGDRGC